MINVIEYLNKQSKSFLIIVGFLVIGVVGFIDYLTGEEISLSIFYLIPIFLVTWGAGKWPGFSISIASATTWLIADLRTGHTYSHFVIPYWNSIVRLGFFFTVTFILSKLKYVLEKEKDSARRDSLTGIANARYFMELANSEMNRSRRYEKPFTIAYIDIDNFKAVNDRFGHSAGDTLLRLIATTVKNNIRTIDIVARLGGDELTILLPETGQESAQGVLRRLRDQLLDAMQKNRWPVTFSMGVVTFIDSYITVDEMIRRADNLMYSAKSSGKNMIKYETFGK